MRRGLGLKLREAGTALTDFVSFLDKHHTSYITQTLALTWAQQPSHTQPAYWAQRLSFVRGFARYRSATDSRTQIPPQGLLPFQPKRARPFLYSDDNIRNLLRAALRMECRYERGKLRPWVYYCLFGLLSVSGLRLGEACKLELQDVDLKAAVLTIRAPSSARIDWCLYIAPPVQCLRSTLQSAGDTGRDEQYLPTSSSPVGATASILVMSIAPSTCCRNRSACAGHRISMGRASMTFAIALRR
jgi:integrase